MAVIRKRKFPTHVNESLHCKPVISNQRSPRPQKRYRTYLADTAGWIRLLQALPQRTRIDLHQPVLLDDAAQVPQDPRPHAGHRGKLDVGDVTPQPDEIEVADHAGPQGAQHLPLRVKVVLEQPLIRGAGAGARCGLARPHVRRAVDVDGDLVHVMHGADGEVGAAQAQQRVRGRRGRGADPLGLEADEQRDGGGVFGAQAEGLGDVRVVARQQLGDGGAGLDLASLRARGREAVSFCSDGQRLGGGQGQRGSPLRDTGPCLGRGACAR